MFNQEIILQNLLILLQLKGAVKLCGAVLGKEGFSTPVSVTREQDSDDPTASAARGLSLDTKRVRSD